MNKKIKFFLPIVIAFFLSTINISNFNLYFEWIFGWTSVYSDYQVYTNILHSFFIGCLSWSIVAYYFGTINIGRFKRGVKSIFVFFPFWFGLCIFVGSFGLSSFSNPWIVIHILLRVWVGAGLLFAGIMVLNFIAYRIYKPILKGQLFRVPMEMDKLPFEHHSNFNRFINLIEKSQLSIFIFIILVSGIFSIVSSTIGSGGINFLTTINLFFMLIIVNFLYDVNYLFSKKKEKVDHFKIKMKYASTKQFDNILNNFEQLIHNGNKFYYEESYELAVENWNEAIKIYSRFNKMVIKKKMIKLNLRTLKENLNDAYNGAVISHLKNAQEAYLKLDFEFAKNEWNSAIDNLYSILKIRKLAKRKLSRKEIMLKIEDITVNLKRIEIENVIAKADNELKSAHVLQDLELANAIKLTNEIILMYSNAIKRAKNFRIYREYEDKLQNRLLNVRLFQEKLQEKLDKSLGITPLEKRVKFEVDELSEYEIASLIKDELIKQILSIVREYEFIGGQVRFKIGLINNTNYPLTNFRITFDLPKSLKWIMHEPNFERKGDSILIPKLGANEKKAASLYLEPLNCMESHINATVSFFDVKDKPHAIPMKPKMIAISCPIFFTESDANLARVKSLRRNLTHRDKKVFPIIDVEKAEAIFSSILSVLEQFDIKLISNEFSGDDNFGEAWFFGITKVKKEQLVMNVFLDGNRKTLEFEVSGNNEEQITAFLAEIGDRVRQKLIENNIINSEEGFYDMRIAILSCLCPYCYTLMTSEAVEKFCNGEIITCENCSVNIKID